MRLILFGATGMIGQGVLRESLRDGRVDSVLSISRRPSGRSHPKLREIVRADPGDLSGLEAELKGRDACLFCLGISSVGLREAQYAAVTEHLTLRVATALAGLDPGMTFVYVSAAGSDASERGRVMWARVRGRTENALFRLPFKRVYAVRPAGIRPRHGIRSRTPYVDAFYRVLAPALPVIQRALPSFLTDTDELARAMLRLAGEGGRVRVIEARDIPGLGRTDP
ncbi:NAD(P)H-binding protein [Methylobacterium durans]|uniref:NAD-dependent epimerase/dehydratase family protein n=1 Tax=Methylobacterium durans TaxID=2202825 RepID=UPI002AFEC39B|nr:NAD-dependent epimerase/dehydratase family protein [Methylobacterium durans]MEA1834536.1 NAD(P)H-binding protein [Methylobacterium durans]